MIFVWGTFATLRRILSLIALFLPSMGLFNILHHWRWEQIPFSTRMEYAKRGFLRSDDKISLYGLNETIFWTELDRWDYSDPQNPAPPHYSIYTFSLQTTFIAGAALMALQFILILVTKIKTSPEFRKKGHYVNKFIHVILNINFATPFYDWDEGNHTSQEFKARFRGTCSEMAATFCVNILSTLLMLVPIFYTAYQVNKRHRFLEKLITVKDEEVASHENIHTCLITVTMCVLVLSIIEVASYFLYLNLFHPWIKIIKDQRNKSEPEKDENNNRSQMREVEIASTSFDLASSGGDLEKKPDVVDDSNLTQIRIMKKDSSEAWEDELQNLKDYLAEMRN